MAEIVVKDIKCEKNMEGTNKKETVEQEPPQEEKSKEVLVAIFLILLLELVLVSLHFCRV